MATSEFIQKRIDGRKAELDKLNKKLARIEKAKASNWEKNPYYYHESDLNRTIRDIAEVEESIAKYEEELARQVEKDNSRDVKIILEFLENWKARVIEYYKKNVEAYYSAWSIYYDADKRFNKVKWELAKKYNRRSYNLCLWNITDPDDKDEFRVAWEDFESAKNMYDMLKDIGNYVICNCSALDEAKLKKDLDKEANAKYDDMIEKVNHIVGQIIDASSLKIGEKGDINGIIEGTNGKASIKTIGAGGYNIQCYHFRTLIRRVR